MTDLQFEVVSHRYGVETAKYEEPSGTSGNGHDTTGSGTEDTHLEWVSAGYDEWSIVMKNQSSSVGATVRIYVANEDAPGNNDWVLLSTIVLSTSENNVVRVVGKYNKIKVTCESAGAGVSEHMKYDVIGG